MVKKGEQTKFTKVIDFAKQYQTLANIIIAISVLIGTAFAFENRYVKPEAIVSVKTNIIALQTDLDLYKLTQEEKDLQNDKLFTQREIWALEDRVNQINEAMEQRPRGRAKADQRIQTIPDDLIVRIRDLRLHLQTVEENIKTIKSRIEGLRNPQKGS